MGHVIEPLNSAQAPFDGNIDFSCTVFGLPNTLYSDGPSIESAMEGLWQILCTMTRPGTPFRYQFIRLQWQLLEGPYARVVHSEILEK
jgi:hypothetical protein